MSSTSTPSGSPTRYHEVQRFRQWWIWVIVAIVVGLAWWTFVQQVLLVTPFGNRPAPDWVVWIIFVLCGLGVPVFVRALKLVVTVDDSGVVVRYVPFVRRQFAWSDLEGWEAVAYQPIRQYGGWGIRWRPGRGWAYTVCGDRGVRFSLADGKTLLVGSATPDALVGALDAARPAAEGGD